jgi:hypothetical protein
MQLAQGCIEVRHHHSMSYYGITLEEFSAIAYAAGWDDETITFALSQLLAHKNFNQDGYYFNGVTNIAGIEWMVAVSHSDEEKLGELITKFNLNKNTLLHGITIVIPFRANKVDLDTFYNGLRSQVSEIPAMPEEMAALLAAEQAVTGKMAEITVPIMLRPALVEKGANPDNTWPGCTFISQNAIIKIGQHLLPREEWTKDPVLEIYLRLPQEICGSYTAGIMLITKIVEDFEKALYANKAAD